MGLAYEVLENYDEALKCNQKALKLLEQLLGEESPYMAFDYYQIALNLEALKRYEEALDYAQKALLITKKDIREEHPLAISIQNTTASILEKMGKPDQALVYLENFLTIQKKIYQDRDHLKMVDKLKEISKILGILNRQTEASLTMEKAQSMQLRIQERKVWDPNALSHLL